MTLNEGEVVVQIDQVDEGWWYGMSEDGKRQGLFPGKMGVVFSLSRKGHALTTCSLANYVQVLEEEVSTIVIDDDDQDANDCI